MKNPIIIVLQFYKKYLSCFLPPACRFYPTCSEYWIDAIRKHGTLHGSWLGVRRLIKCHPWHPGGYDPVI